MTEFLEKELLSNGFLFDQSTKKSPTSSKKVLNAVIGSNLHDADRLLITFGNQYDAIANILIEVYRNVSENLQTHIEQPIKHAAKPENRRNIKERLLYDFDLNVDFMEKNMNIVVLFEKDYKKLKLTPRTWSQNCKQ